MSKLDELIAELCPDGVEYVKLSSICDIKRGERVTKSQLIEDGIYPVFSGGVSPMGYFNKFNREENTITIAQYGTAGYVNWIDEKFWANDVCYSLFPKEVINKRYLYFVLVNLQDYIYTLRIDAVPAHLPVDRLGNIKIPLPPLAVQQEIVRILDNFTELTAELTAELIARRKQYEYYRNLLLTFDDNTEVKWMTLGEISINTYSGGTPRANHPEYYGGDIPWLRTQEVRFVDINDTEMRITSAALKNSAAKWIPENCVIIAISGATAARSAINKIPLTTNQHCCCLEINPKQAKYRYVFHWVSSQYKNLKSLGQGARSDLNSGIIKNYPIPIPPLEEQERIVAILDRFDALCNDLTSGIPAEIEARQKQYEYYRDKLLSFKEVTS